MKRKMQICGVCKYTKTGEYEVNKIHIHFYSFWSKKKQMFQLRRTLSIAVELTDSGGGGEEPVGGEPKHTTTSKISIKHLILSGPG
jgi:hypothetical protein